MSIDRKSKSIPFIMGVVIATAFVYLMEGRARYFYSDPPHLIPLRHTALSPNLGVKQQIFVHTKTNVKTVLPQLIFETRFQKAFESSKIVGMKVFLGTYGKPIDLNKVVVAFTTKDFIYTCVSFQGVLIKDNQWFDAKIHCEKTKHGPIVSNVTTIEFQSDENDPVAIYYGNCDAIQNITCQDQDFPAIDFVASIFPDDIPNSSFENAMNYGGIWNKNWLSVLRIAIRLIIIVTFGFFTVLSIGFIQTYPKIDMPNNVPLFSFVSLALWTILLMHQAIQNPPFHDPDEPKHVRGLLQDALPAEAIQQSEQILGQNAVATHYSQTTKTRIVPIINEAPPSQGFGVEEGSVAPITRSLFYPYIARPLVRAAFDLFQAHDKKFTNDLGIYLKAFFTFPIIIFGFLTVLINIFLRRYASIGIFLATIFTPALIPLTPIISNYGFAIIVGASTASFIYPEGRYVSRIVAVIAAILCTFLTASLATSQGFFLFLGMAATFVSVIYTIQERDFCSLSQKKLLVLVTGLGFVGAWYLCDVSFGTSWIGGRGSFEDMVSEFDELTQVKDYLIKSHSPLWSLLVFCIAFLSLGLLFVSFSCHLHAQSTEKFVQDRPLSENEKWTKFRVRVTAIFLIALGCLAYKVNSRYPLPEYIQSLYLSTVPKPPFGSFLAEAVSAITSQTFETVQDYFLFQSFILAYCLDTTAPPQFYFVVRQIVHLGCIAIVLALIWRARKSFLLILPIVLAYLVYLVCLFYGAWVQGHTLVGRYTFPGWGFGIVPFILAVAFLVSKKEERDIPAIFVVSTVFIFVSVLTTLYGQSFLLPMRFVVGGKWY